MLKKNIQILIITNFINYWVFNTTLFFYDNISMCACKDADSFLHENGEKKVRIVIKSTDKNLHKNVSQGCN